MLLDPIGAAGRSAEAMVRGDRRDVPVEAARDSREALVLDDPVWKENTIGKIWGLKAEKSAHSGLRR